MSNDTKTSIQESKQRRTRSPAYPAIDLQTAIARASALWTKIKSHAAPLDSIAGYWGYEKSSSKAMSEASAMIKYGLLSDDGTGTNRTIKLTDAGIKLSYDPDTASAEHWNGVKKAALSPTIHRELWERYSGNLPDDAVIKRYLVVDRKFNDQYVDEFISQFRRTIEFAKLSSSDMIEGEHETESSKMIATTAHPRPIRSKETPGQSAFSQQAGQPHDILATPKRPLPRNSDLSLPLGNGDFVVIPKMTQEDYDLFLETLKLWKKKLILPDAERDAKETFPFVVLWKNKDFDKMVKIIGVAGEKDGQKYYQSEDGTGIPSKELFPGKE